VKATGAMELSRVMVVAVVTGMFAAGACQRDDTTGGVAGDAEPGVPAGAIPAPGTAPATGPEAAGAPLDATADDTLPGRDTVPGAAGF
jgi:hypothetical protein